jgi:hypothetical protein
VTVRRGSISAPGFKATAYRGSEPAFRGRIAVERGSGMVEFPSLKQLPRILREEGIPSSAADRAFGHDRLRANGDEVVRHGYLRVGDTEASEYAGPEKKLAGKIHVSSPDVDTYKSPQEFARLAEKIGISSESVLAAFGHLLHGARLSEAGQTKEITYGGRSTKLGHVTRKGTLAAGTRKGSLVLIEKKTARPVWGVIEEPLGTLRNMSTNRTVSLDGVFAKAKTLKIPPQAVYDAFGHLMNAEDRKRLIATFHGMSLAKNSPYRSSAQPKGKSYKHGIRMRAKRAAQRARRRVRRTTGPVWPFYR